MWTRRGFVQPEFHKEEQESQIATVFAQCISETKTSIVKLSHFFDTPPKLWLEIWKSTFTSRNQVFICVYFWLWFQNSNRKLRFQFGKLGENWLKLKRQSSHFRIVGIQKIGVLNFTEKTQC